MASSRTPYLLAFFALFDIVQHGLTQDIHEAATEASLLAVEHRLYKVAPGPASKLQELWAPGGDDSREAAPYVRREVLRAAPAAPAAPAAAPASAAQLGATPERTATPAKSAAPTTSHDAAERRHTLIRQIFVLCVTMYSSIGLLWTFYWQRQKASLPGASQSLETFYVALLCVSWASMSVGMHVLNKSLVEYLQAPAIISGAQMLMAVVVMGATSGDKLFTVPPGQLKRWLVVPILFAGMLCSSFYAYERISLSLLTVVRNLTPLVALPIESVIMPPDKRPIVTLPIVAAILIMLVGAVVYGDGILPTLSVVGLMYAVLNMTLAVTDRLMQRRLLTQECKDLPSDVCTIVNNTLGLIPTIALAAATHQLSDMALPAHRMNWTDPRVMVLLLISGLVGIGICYLGFQCQRAISATSFFVLQNVSKVAVVSAGVLFFGDPIKSAASVFGLLLSLGGSFMYGAANMMQQAPAKSARDTRADCEENLNRRTGDAATGESEPLRSALDRQLKQRNSS